ncbi:MAG TPA: hypothetical protein VG711_04310, partial [Phycisphaerales bacterium]|nr:hypothetical protein [Phycisphaerales bacterium]
MATPQMRFRSPSLHDDSRLDWSPTTRKPNPFLNKHMMVIGAGVLCALLLLIVILNIKTGTGPTLAEENASAPKAEELVPTALGNADSNTKGFDYAHGTIDAPQGAWISITDPKTGRLVQQYRFDYMNPNPPGKGPEWIAMDNPQVKLFMESNRVVVLTGKSSLAHAPQRALVSGSITGDVTINVYEPQDGKLPDTSTAPSSLTVNTEQASFDNFLGEVRCDGPVLINHPRAEIPAHNLRLLINDTNNTLSLHMDGADYIRLHPDEQAAIAQGAAGNAMTPAQASQASASKSSNRTSSTHLASAEGSPKSAAKSDGGAKPAESSTSAATRPSKRAKSAADAPTFYHLVLHDNVRIVQGDGQTGKVLTGDTLSVIFSSKTKSLEDTTLSSRDFVAPSSLRSFLLAPSEAPISAIAALSFAQTSRLAAGTSSATSLQPGETMITFTGPVTLEPLKDSSLAPPTPEDALFDLAGAPVTVHDYSKDTSFTCASARYTTADERVDLLADADHIVHMTSGNYLAEGRHAWLAQTTGLAGFVGDGWLGQVESSAPSTSQPASQPESEAPAASQPTNPLVQLKISWTKGVDLAMDPATSGSQSRKLRKATFKGDVHVESPELALDAETMHVGFRADSGETNSIESIIAEGAPAENGQPGKGVAADQRTQMLFADYLHVTLVSAAKSPESQPEPVHDSTDTSLKDKAAQVQVNTLTAKGDVQILLPDGTRVFADDVFADALKRTVSLKGTDVLIVHDTTVIQKGSDIEIDDTAGFSHMDGPGQALILSQPVPVIDHHRIAKPVLNEDVNPIQARVHWDQGAEFNHRANDGAGSLTVRGNVDAESHPSDLEKNTMTGDALTIDFQNNSAVSQPVPTTSAAAATSPAESTGFFKLSPTANSGSRIASRLVATGNAKLQNTVMQDAHDTQPRIFYIAGDSVDYDALTTEALINSAGELLIRDVHSPEQAAASSPDKSVPLPDAPFSSRG